MSNKLSDSVCDCCLTSRPNLINHKTYLDFCEECLLTAPIFVGDLEVIVRKYAIEKKIIILRGLTRPTIQMLDACRNLLRVPSACDGQFLGEICDFYNLPGSFSEFQIQKLVCCIIPSVMLIISNE